MRLFEYHRPTTVGEATRLLADLGDGAAVLAGGTSVMNMAKLGLAEPEHVVALSGVPDLYGISGRRDRGVTLGAMTTLRDVETSGVIRELAPGLAKAAGHVATVRIRNQATVGGTLVHADPNQDLPPMLMVHDAVARLTGPAGTRDIAVSDMFVSFFESVLGPQEILESVQVPAVAAGMRTGYLKVGYPFHCHVPATHSRLCAARHGRSSGGWARLPGRERGPFTPSGLIVLGCGSATSCR